MRTILRAALLLAALSAVAVAQPTAYVAYDGARLYSDADYLSAIIDTLAIGDTLAVLDREKKFLHVRFGTVAGWVLAANVTDRPPKAAAAPKASSRKKEKRGDGAAEKPPGKGGDAAAGNAGGAAGGKPGDAAAGRAGDAPAGRAGDAPAGNAGETAKSDARDRSLREKGGTAPGAPRGSSSGVSAKEVSPTAQCAATTRSGRQCTRKAGASSAYCWQHAK